MAARKELLEIDDDDRREDHYVHLYGATWADYERLQAIRRESAVPRITYLDGLLEIMSPSTDHEVIKSTIGCLVEVWCLEHDLEFTTFGSWTVKNKRRKAGAEADECWVIGPMPRARRLRLKRPDLAIEVVWTSGGINKLDVWRKLGVPEVWFWRRGLIRPYVLRRGRYEAVEQSVVLPRIDLELLTRFLDRPTTSRAIRDYRAALAR